MLSIKDVMSENVETADIKDSIVYAAKKMSKKNIGCLVITNNNKPYGMLTERDLLKKVVGVNKDYRKLKVEDVMHVPLMTVNKDLSIIKACELIDHKSFRRLPITENGKLIGIATETDLTRALRNILTDSLQTFIKNVSK